MEILVCYIYCSEWSKRRTCFIATRRDGHLTGQMGFWFSNVLVTQVCVGGGQSEVSAVY